MNKDKKENKIQISAHALWRERARFRSENRKWLGYSGKIALRILSALEDRPDMNQKLLAKEAGVSAQQVSKILKGQENLTLKSIAKFSEILGLELISFPSFKYNESSPMQISFEITYSLVILCIPQNHMFLSDIESPYTFIEYSKQFPESGFQYISI